MILFVILLQNINKYQKVRFRHVGVPLRIEICTQIWVPIDCVIVTTVYKLLNSIEYIKLLTVILYPNQITYKFF